MGTGYSAATAAIWSERVRAWRASGETATQFAEGKGYAGSTLRFWSSRLKTTRSGSAPRIVELVTRRAERAREMLIEVGAARIRIERGFDCELLVEVVAALSGARR